MKLFTVNRATRWKRDIQIAAEWINTPLIFFTLASFIYNFTNLLRQSLEYWQFLIISGMLFVPLYKFLGRTIVALGIYGKQRTYDISIDPYSQTKLTPKERTILFPPTIFTMKLNLKYLGQHLTDEERRNYEKTIAKLEEAVRDG